MSWGPDEYDHALLYAIALKRPADEDRICEAYLRSPLCKGGMERDEWEGKREYLHLAVGSGGSRKRISELSTLHPSSSELRTYLAKATEVLGEKEQAAVLHEEAAELAKGSGNRISILASLRAAARTYAEAGNIPASDRAVDQLRQLTQEAGEEAENLDLIANLAEKHGQSAVRIAALERRLAIDPSNSDDRFNLGYLYNEVGDPGAAVRHYLAIPEAVRSHGAWNNIGVAWEALAAPIKAVDAYKKASEGGGARAAANLAAQLLSAGFLTEAREYCEKARDLEPFDSHVTSVAVRLSESTGAEDEKSREVLERATNISRFYRGVGAALSNSQPSSLGQDWEQDSVSLQLKEDGAKLEFHGSYSTKNIGLGLFFAGTPDVLRFELRFVLARAGRAVFGKMYRHSLDQPETLLTKNSDGVEVVGVISASGTEIELMQQPTAKEPRTVLLRRKRVPDQLVGEAVKP